MKKIRRILVGSTGFVGTNLQSIGQFEALASSANISNYAGLHFDEMTIAAGDARKWYANQNADKDLIHINTLIDGVKKIKADRVIHFSTVDVFANREGSELELAGNVSKEAYGNHRYYMEQCLMDLYENVNVIRLPGLFGSGLKKNIIFDILHGRPLQGFNLKSTFQWFNLNDLPKVLTAVEHHNIDMINVCSEPISVEELLRFLGIKYEDSLLCSTPVVKYDIKSEHASKFDGRKYLFSKEYILESIHKFCNSKRAI